MTEPTMSAAPYDYPEDAYPGRHPKGSYWATDIGWDILDRLPIGTLDNAQRAYLCGLIGGALSNEREGRKQPDNPLKYLKSRP